MIREEALIYLPVDDENDAEDLYDEKLFELKQFFLSRFPMSKLITARVAKFEKIEQAYQELGGVVSDDSIKTSVSLPSFDSIHEANNWYNAEKNSLRLQLLSATSIVGVEHALQLYVQMTQHYARYWKVPVNEEDRVNVKIGVEPNPMDIQSALNGLSDIEKLNSEYILSLPDDNCLKSEAKRLSLWLNFEFDEQSI